MNNFQYLIEEIHKANETVKQFINVAWYMTTGAYINLVNSGNVYYFDRHAYNFLSNSLPFIEDKDLVALMDNFLKCPNIDIANKIQAKINEQYEKELAKKVAENLSEQNNEH